MIGDKYGMLYIQQHEYDCFCEDYFFTTSDQDHIFRICMNPSFDGKSLCMYLPNGYKGSFEIISDSEGFNDDYVLHFKWFSSSS